MSKTRDSRFQVACLYRVSTLSQVDPDGDLSVQKNACREYARMASRANAWRDWYAARGWHYTLHASRGPRHELFSMVMAAAAAGLGVGLVPLLLAREALDAGRLVQAHPQALPGTQGYWFVRPQHRPGSEALQAFSAWLATHWQKMV